MPLKYVRPALTSCIFTPERLKARKRSYARSLMTDGLEGVIAVETVLSHADGEGGMVWVRGHTIIDLVAHHGYEGAVALLWDGFAGERLTRQSVLVQLGEARTVAFSRLASWLPTAANRPLIEGVRIALAALPEDSFASNILAVLPVALAALLRKQEGKSPVAPDATLTTAADFLRMMGDAPATEKLVTALDAYLTAVIDNGLGTSTFVGNCEGEAASLRQRRSRRHAGGLIAKAAKDATVAARMPPITCITVGRGELAGPPDRA
jgi:citrate synthase